VGSMIKNDFQYQVTQEWVEKFKKSIVVMTEDEEGKKNNFEKWESRLCAMQYRLEKLQAEIAEYENLTSVDSQTPIVLTLDDIYYLPQLLIKARIAAKLSQKELGALAGLTEEQIKNYEAKDYEGASFTDVMGLFLALDIKIQKGEFLVPLDTLRRTPVTKEELRSSKSLQKQQINKLLDNRDS
jgi:transcriptional regulator with XRE-family HTH domain